MIYYYGICLLLLVFIGIVFGFIFNVMIFLFLDEMCDLLIIG